MEDDVIHCLFCHDFITVVAFGGPSLTFYRATGFEDINECLLFCLSLLLLVYYFLFLALMGLRRQL